MCFSHPKAADGFTLSNGDKGIRKFWIEHCIRSGEIGATMGKVLGNTCVTNVWIPDSMKNTPADCVARTPAKGDKTGGDGDAGYTVKQGQPHYGYKAHVVVDETHTLIRLVMLTAANVHDSQEFENVVRGDEKMVMADTAYWSQARSESCGKLGVANGIMRKPSRGQKLRPVTMRANWLFSSIRCKIEKLFGWWKRSEGYRRVRYVGHKRNRLELEFQCVCWNLKRLAKLSTSAEFDRRWLRQD